MKRLLALLLVVVIVVAASACSNSSGKSESSDTQVSVSTTFSAGYDNQDSESLPEEIEEIIEIFKANPYAELEGYELDDFGMLYDTKNHDWIKNIHIKNNTHCLESFRTHAYCLDDNILTKYAFGEAEATLKIDPDFVYCGFFKNNGLIFRKGTNVYCVDLNLTKMQKIASGVKFVISTSYMQNDDARSQPIFLMKNGEIKVFIEWDGGYLTTPQYEGGHGGTLVTP